MLGNGTLKLTHPCGLAPRAMCQRQALLYKICQTWVCHPGMEVVPARLESTCLVLLRGADLFLTRVQPSLTFDRLSPDFPFALLLVVTGALIAASVILNRMDASAAVKRKWT